MFTTTESSSSSKHHSPPSMPGDFPRKNLPSPWAQVVRGVEPESTPGARQSPPLPPSSSSSSSSLATSTASAPDQPSPLSSSPDSSSPEAVPVSPPADNCGDVAAGPSDASDGGDGNAGWHKKQAWNKPSNGVVAEAGPVMGAESWPALSESTKASAKLAAESSSKTVTVDDVPLATSQGTITPQTPQRQAISHANAKPNPAPNYNRQRTMKQGGGSNNVGSGAAQSGFSNPPSPPLPPPFPIYQTSPVGYGNVVPGVPHHSPSGHYRHNNWNARPPVGGFVRGMNEHRGSSRRGNFGPHPRGDGSYRNNHGGRRNQDRVSFGNSRDAHVYQPRIPQRGSRHPPPNTIVAPPPIGPFGSPMGLHGNLYYVPMEHFRSMPLYPHPPAMYFPAAEPSVTNMIANQIEYYFSDDNLLKDEYLRSNMDELGWVPITLIANFPRVKSLTNDIQLILDSLRNSTVVEVHGYKLRRHNEWMRWLSAPHLQSGRFNNHSITLEEATTDEGLTKSSIQSELSNGGDPAQKRN